MGGRDPPTSFIAHSGQNLSGVMCLARWAAKRVMSLVCEPKSSAAVGRSSGLVAFAFLEVARSGSLDMH